jgi:hypothetical protein
MTTPEKNSAQNSGNQVIEDAVSQSQNTVTEEPGKDGEASSYYDSEESLKSRIDELTSIAETGNSDEIGKAMAELTEIEETLVRSKGKATADPGATSKTLDVDPKNTSNAELEDNGEPKKFHVFYDGKKIEREDPNKLLGYKSTGEIKAALVKAQLRLDEMENNSVSLAAKLREAEAKIQQFSQKQAQPSNEQPLKPSAVPPKPLDRPVPPEEPVLSTEDPSLYTEADILAVAKHRRETNEFNRKMIEYVQSFENRSAPENEVLKKQLQEMDERLKKHDEGYQEIEREKQRIAEEKADLAHWNQFMEFQNKHGSYSTDVPIKQLNDDMNKWMDLIAAANGVKKGTNGEASGEYFRQRGQIVNQYLNNDAQVVQNSEGIQPPKGHDKFFKLLELYQALNKYKENSVLGPNATLEHAYLQMKHESGDMEEALDTIRVNERTKATEQFADGVQAFQQNAVNVDPKDSSGGPDVNQLGISSSDLQWFSTITPDKALELKHKNRELFDKYNAIADRIVSIVR